MGWNDTGLDAAVPFDPENTQHLSRLDQSVQCSKQQLKPHCERLFKHKAQLVGGSHSHNSAPAAVPINLIEMGINTLQRFVASRAPQVMVKTRYRELQPQAANLELAINQEARRIGLSDTFNTWAVEALFIMGVVEVGITSSDTPPDAEGNSHDPGRVFVDPVLFHRLILDMSVGSWNEQVYVGHEFDVPLEWVRENPQFDPQVRRLVARPDRSGTAFGDEDEINPARLPLSSSWMDEFEDTITLRQLYLPRQKLVLTFAVGQDEKRPLRIIEWTGPERGPYHPLCYGKVPGSLIPNAPVPQWAPLHELVNSLWNKAGGQAERQKTYHVVRGTATSDAERVKNVPDGHMIYSDDPGGIQEVSTGGANEKTLAMVLTSRNYWNIMAGNIDLMAGTGPQSETASQDRMLLSSASGRVNDLQAATIEAQKLVYEDLGYWLYTDPLAEYPLTKTVEGTDIFIPTVWAPEERTADFKVYDFDINPYSATPRSPQEEANEFVSCIQFLMGLDPLMQAQGQVLDMEYIIKRLAKLKNMPDLARAIQYMEGEAYPDPLAADKPRMPQHTERTYTRRNIPGGNRQSQDEMLAQHLLGLKKQPSEMASLVRSVG